MTSTRKGLRVRTATSVYDLDYTAMTATRLNPAPQARVGGGWLRYDLRRDGDPIPLLEIPDITLGQPMLLVLNVRGDGIETERLTTPVVQIEPLPADPVTAPE